MGERGVLCCGGYAFGIRDTTGSPFGIIGSVNTLQFIDSMTGRLAWPLTVMVIGIIFRRSLVELLGRVRKLRWRDAEAEIAEAAKKAEEAVEATARPLLERGDDRESVERLVQESARWGLLAAIHDAGKQNRAFNTALALLEPPTWSSQALLELTTMLQHTLGEDDDDHDGDDPPLAGVPAR